MAMSCDSAADRAKCISLQLFFTLKSFYHHINAYLNLPSNHALRAAVAAVSLCEVYNSTFLPPKDLRQTVCAARKLSSDTYRLMKALSSKVKMCMQIIIYTSLRGILVACINLCPDVYRLQLTAASQHWPVELSRGCSITNWISFLLPLHSTCPYMLATWRLLLNTATHSWPQWTALSLQVNKSIWTICWPIWWLLDSVLENG